MAEVFWSMASLVLLVLLIVSIVPRIRRLGRDVAEFLHSAKSVGLPHPISAHSMVVLSREILAEEIQNALKHPSRILVLFLLSTMPWLSPRLRYLPPVSQLIYGISIFAAYAFFVLSYLYEPVRSGDATGLVARALFGVILIIGMGLLGMVSILLASSRGAPTLWVFAILLAWLPFGTVLFAKRLADGARNRLGKIIAIASGLLCADLILLLWLGAYVRGSLPVSPEALPAVVSWEMLLQVIESGLLQPAALAGRGVYLTFFLVVFAQTLMAGVLGSYMANLLTSDE